MTRPRRRSGFSLLEALVGVAVLGLALAPLFAIQAQTARTQLRYEQRLLAVTAQRNALAALEALNMSETPEGEAALGPGQWLSWRAAPLSTPAPNLAAADGPAETITLYEVLVEVRDDRDRVLAAFAVDQVGWSATAPVLTQ